MGAIVHGLIVQLSCCVGGGVMVSGLDALLSQGRILPFTEFVIKNIAKDLKIITITIIIFLR